MSGYQGKKRKFDAPQQQQQQQQQHHRANEEVDTSRPSAVFTPTGGRKHTLSIALPGSVIANAQSHDLKTMMAAQVARACAVFQVDEIVVFNDGQSQAGARPRKGFEGDGYTGYSDPDDFLYHVLAYLETPPHLRKTLFPMHPNLRTAGAMPSLDMPHHLRANEWCQYREGVTAGSDSSYSEPHNKKKKGGYTPSTLVDCGLPVNARIPVDVPAGSRITVKFPSANEPQMDGYTPLDAEAVSPDTPREETGYYWGYSTRMASSLSAVFTESPYDGGYDLSFGTSERGITLASLLGRDNKSANVQPVPTQWRHMMIVFGGVAGLEVALKADKDLTSKGVTEAKDVFDYWVNLVPQQGSRTIRTEEAVWLGLMGLQTTVQARQGVSVERAGLLQSGQIVTAELAKVLG